MAFDGITVACLVRELNQFALNAKINKIAQPEADELLLTLKGPNGACRVALSASASLPFVYITETNKPSPLTAPTFCMVLRKHISGGRIISITQPGLERIINFEIEHLNEMGDLCRKKLIVELMGKHSNIIFCDDNNRIIDSIKRVPFTVSSVREVLPGKEYFVPNTQGDKYNPLRADAASCAAVLSLRPDTLTRAIYGSFTGISPVIAHEIAFRAGLDGDAPTAAFSEDELLHAANNFVWMMDDINNGSFAPCIIRKGREPVDFSAVHLSMYDDLDVEASESISHVLEAFYSEKDVYNRIRQKSVDLRKIVGNALERNQKKYQLQLKQLKDSDKREKYRVYGELLQAFGYSLAPGAKELVAENYYDDNKEIKIPLDPSLSAQENAVRYFDKYTKMKRTAEALAELTAQTRSEIDHLESIQNSLEIALTADDLVQIRQELTDYGFIRHVRGQKKEKVKSRPFHYISSDGYDIYVGKNNYQNDELTFKFATGNDWWFHAKGMPGSHVVVKANNQELPDRVFEEAGALAGFYSKGRANDKVEIDYLQKKNVKKPNGAVPGFVVYYTNYSLTVAPDITGLKMVQD